MPSQPIPKIPSIKLKLSVSGNPPPSTPTPPAPSTISSKKGKGKAVEQDPVTTTIKLRAPGPPSVPSEETPSLKKAPKKGTDFALSTPSLQIKLPATHATDLDLIPTQNVCEPGPSTITVTTTPRTLPTGLPPNAPSSVAISTPLIGTSRSKVQLPKVTPSKHTKSKLQKNASRPSAIPARLLSSSAPSTPIPTTPLSSHVSHSPSPLPTTEVQTPAVKTEPGVEVPLDESANVVFMSLPISPSAQEENPTPRTMDTPGEQAGEVANGKTPVKWMRLRRPFKELAQKVLNELRRRDDYGLFLVPVKHEDYPNYLEMIGGEENMMDFETMQGKLDSGEYKNMDQIETDLRTLVTAAQNFNPQGTIPHTSAGRILLQGLKHIDRSRPLVLTPSPSPARDSASATPWRGQSRFSGRENTVLTDDGTGVGSSSHRTKLDIAPHLTIPEQMLSFPPNSLAAYAVGWNLTGGRRIRPKRFARGREKFSGKWREWDMDGSRDLGEMDDPELWFSEMRQKSGTEWRRITDWKNMRTEDSWWDWEGIGGPTGQPPLPGTSLPRREEMKKRELGWDEWGVYPEVEAELTLISRSRPGGSGIAEDGMKILAEHLRPSKPRPQKGSTGPANFVNIYDDVSVDKRPGDWLREIATGGVEGEAYLRSVDKFVKGAMESAAGRHSRDRNTDTGKERDEDKIGLDEYVWSEYHGGILQTEPSRIIRKTLDELNHLSSTSTSAHRWLPTARAAYASQALRLATAPSMPLDIRPLLVLPGDFMYAGIGIGGKSGVGEGLNFIGKEIASLVESRKAACSTTKGESGRILDMSKAENGAVNGVDKKRRRDDFDGGRGENGTTKRNKVDAAVSSAALTEQSTTSTSSSPLTQPPDSPPEQNGALPKVNGEISTTPVQPSSTIPKGTDSALPGASEVQDPLTTLRLELIALSKFYPLAALRKMGKEEAERLLPANVRGLMSR